MSVLDVDGLRRVSEGESDNLLNAKMFLDKPELQRVISVNGSVRGITTLGNDVFVILNGVTNVNVYDVNQVAVIRTLKIAGSSTLHEIVASLRNNCLYISDHSQQVVHRHDLSNDVVTQWPTGGQCYGLSLTNIFNVLVTLMDTKKIKEYSPDGSLIREISLDSRIVTHGIVFSCPLIE